MVTVSCFLLYNYVGGDDRNPCRTAIGAGDFGMIFLQQKLLLFLPGLGSHVK